MTATDTAERLFDIAWGFGLNAAVARRSGLADQAQRDRCRSLAALTLARRVRAGGIASVSEIEPMAAAMLQWRAFPVATTTRRRSRRAA